MSNIKTIPYIKVTFSEVDGLELSEDLIDILALNIIDIENVICDDIKGLKNKETITTILSRIYKSAFIAGIKYYENE